VSTPEDRDDRRAREVTLTATVKVVVTSDEVLTDQDAVEDVLRDAVKEHYARRLEYKFLDILKPEVKSVESA
jgi:hypothetical protein